MVQKGQEPHRGGRLPQEGAALPQRRRSRVPRPPAEDPGQFPGQAPSQEGMQLQSLGELLAGPFPVSLRQVPKGLPSQGQGPGHGVVPFLGQPGVPLGFPLEGLLF